jgi:hypothetical protein
MRSVCLHGFGPVDPSLPVHGGIDQALNSAAVDRSGSSTGLAMNASSDASSQTIFESFMARVYGNPGSDPAGPPITPSELDQAPLSLSFAWQGGHLANTSSPRAVAPTRAQVRGEMCGRGWRPKCGATPPFSHNCSELPRSVREELHYLRSLRIAQEWPATPTATEDVSVLRRAQGKLGYCSRDCMAINRASSLGSKWMAAGGRLSGGPARAALIAGAEVVTRPRAW